MLSKERKYSELEGKLEPVNHIIMAVLWGGIQGNRCNVETHKRGCS